MADVTKIQWTDHTFNPWVGCSKVHAGCTNCYAEADFDKRRHFAKWGPHGTRVLTSSAYWQKPIGWNREAERHGIRRKVFCASLADVFEDWDGPITDKDGNQLFDMGYHAWRPAEQINRRAFPGFDPSDSDFMLTMRDIRKRLFWLIDETPWLDWLLLTKRPENVIRMWPLTPGIPRSLVEFDESGKAVDYKTYDRATQLMYRPNVWIGTSVSDQETAEKAIPELLTCRDLSPVLFLSAEPLLGPVCLTRLENGCGETYNALTAEVTTGQGHTFRTSDRDPVDWLIVGGESGPNARPNNLAWTRTIISQCQDADVPCFHKQIGSFPVETMANDVGAFVTRQVYVNDRRHGGNPDEWERALRVRQFPQGSR